jgi:hypothetical protein
MSAPISHVPILRARIDLRSCAGELCFDLLCPGLDVPDFAFNRCTRVTDVRPDLVIALLDLLANSSLQSTETAAPASWVLQ